jgi:hypothetical protein
MSEYKASKLKDIIYIYSRKGFKSIIPIKDYYQSFIGPNSNKNNWLKLNIPQELETKNIIDCADTIQTSNKTSC